MTTYISRTDTAKLIRKALKEHFSDTKFSVKCRTGSASIEVEWTDGPTAKSVESIVKVFEGASYDGMYDSKTYNYSTLNGEEVQYGADYVIARRNYSMKFVKSIALAFCAHNRYNILKIRISGNEEHAWADARELGYSEDHWFKQLLENTDAKDMHRPYTAQEEHEQAERNAWMRNAAQRQAEEKARQEKEAAERAKADAARRQQEQAQAKARKEQEERRQREQAARRTTSFYTREQALAYLGLTNTATPEQVKTAFRNRVKAAADGCGGYRGDMDLLVTAKEKALQR